jgi:hypothetical protein
MIPCSVDNVTSLQPRPVSYPRAPTRRTVSSEGRSGILGIERRARYSGSCRNSCRGNPRQPDRLRIDTLEAGFRRTLQRDLSFGMMRPETPQR